MVDIYVGIDPGSKNCALVAWSPTRGLITTWKPKGTMPSGVLRLRRLMVEIDAELRKLDKIGEVRQIAMEAYSMAERYGQHASGEIGATIKLTILAHFPASDRRAYPVLVAPQQLKKFVAGNGNTKKEMIPKEVLKRWSMDFNDTNIAEAYVLARVAYAVEADPEMTQFQRDVVTALEGRTEFDPAAMFPKRRLVRVGR
jgi:Holliday junction resolvasome RuvABC endonuclease subunit